jgi:carboxypeptidase Q
MEKLSTGFKAVSVCKLLSMRPLAKIPLVGLLISGCAFGQAAPASAPISPMALRMEMVHRAAEQTDPMPELEQLCDEIGPRLTGGIAAQAAERQVLEYMRKIGLQQVHTEGWTLPRGWQRGPATASLVTPFRIPIPIAAYGWTGSTPTHSGPVQVVLLHANDVAEHLNSLVESQASNWSGKALIVGSDPDKSMRAYSELLPLLRAASAAHAVVVLRHDTRPGNGIVHSEPLAVALPETIDTNLIPAVDLPAEHQRLIERLLLQNRPVSIDIRVENSFSAGPVPSENIVGEIEGVVHPEQVLLVSAHLDSWDLGTGATDDGFGAAAVLGAAQALVRTGLRPARTLRFMLFTGEEEGLLGSRAYVRQHAAELGNIVAVFALDWGAGPIVRLPTAGHPELLPLLGDFNELTPDLHLEPPDDGWLFMTDAYAFTLVGLPGIAPLVRAPGYFEQAHSAEDTLDKVSPADLRQAMTVLGMASFFLADGADIPQEHFTPAQTAAALIQGKQKPMLEVFGLWPF